jgi:putative salt-induced outer membrane protein YdiY
LHGRGKGIAEKVELGNSRVLKWLGVYVTIRRAYLLICTFAALVLSGPFSVAADEVRLANGDRLTGEIERMEEAVLILKTSYAGELKLMWSEVVCIGSDRELTFRLKNREVMVGSATCPADGRIQIMGVRVGKSAEIPLDELDAINPSPPPPAVRYKGNINGGGTLTEGNTDEASIYLSGNFEARSKRHRFTLGGRYNYGETDGEITTRNALGRLKYDFFVRERLYTYAQARFERDDFQDLNLRSTMGLGVGYQIFDTERTSLFTEVGVSYFNEDFMEAEDQKSASARESTGFTFDIVPKRIKLFHLHEFYYRWEKSDSYYLSSEQGLRFLLFRNFFANFQVDFDYNSQPAPGREKKDTRYIASIGYEFDF